MAKSLEEYVGELKEIAEQLSGEDTGLEEAIALYKKGSEAAKKAEKLLSKYEAELEIVNDTGGTAEEDGED